MNSKKLFLVAAVVIGALAFYFFHLSASEFANVNFLGGLLFLEILIFCVWKYEQFFFLLTVVAFVWAGATLPLRAEWIAGRWAVLATGAVIGLIVWTKRPHLNFSAFHLLAAFCVVSAFVSATVSPFRQLALSKALSLLLLFLYGCGGARASALGREERFVKGVLLGSEIFVYITAIAYVVTGTRFWGNPNSMGAVMSMGIFPVMLWGWFTSSRGLARWRRLAALFLCTYLSFASMARAGMAAIILLILAFCFCMRQYKLLFNVALLTLAMIAVMGMQNPTALNETAGSLRDAVLYKGHKEEGVLGSRRTPWERTIANLKQRPWFGTGYGTSATGENVGTGAGRYASTAETAREHGSSYMCITEWVGLFGVLPFAVLILLNVFHVVRVGLWLHRTRQAAHYSVPLAMVLFAAFIHAGFEDWMFAVGSYASVVFWSYSFILTDLLPSSAASVRIPARQKVLDRWPFPVQIASPGQ